ncbi:MAG: hypothetical protein M3Y84_07110 [Acidobacteriota bacterium]|nr:hypothetical protein [Acidobacteriota bacterium]
MGLRDRGIYRLPNGRELVAFLYATGTPVLYNLWAKNPQMVGPAGGQAADQVHYELNEAGRLLFQGQLTAWSMEDLSDTGRTASSELAPVERVNAQGADEVANERIL